MDFGIRVDFDIAHHRNIMTANNQLCILVFVNEFGGKKQGFEAKKQTFVGMFMPCDLDIAHAALLGMPTTNYAFWYLGHA